MVDRVEATNEEKERLGFGYAVFLHNRAMDIHAALTVLGRRTVNYETEEQQLNLILTDLGGANLRRAHLERAILGSAQLDNAKLIGTYLHKAHLAGANLKGGTLRWCEPEGSPSESRF